MDLKGSGPIINTQKFKQNPIWISCLYDQICQLFRCGIRNFEVYRVDITFGHVGGQRNPLVFADELAHFVNLLVAHLAQRRLVNATEDVRLHRLANVELKSPSDTPTPASPSPSASSHDGRITRMSSERFISCTTSPSTPTSSESATSTRTPLPSIWSWTHGALSRRRAFR